MTAAEWHRAKAIKAQREAAELSARIRSQVSAISVYRVLPGNVRDAAAKCQADVSKLYGVARDWVDGAIAIDVSVNWRHNLGFPTKEP